MWFGAERHRGAATRKSLGTTGLNRLFVYADIVDLDGDNIHALSNSDTFVAECSEIGLQVNVVKTLLFI
jgi:hypothetical protein